MEPVRAERHSKDGRFCAEGDIMACNVRDLPRREEPRDTRPLMLGLIDDLPRSQERRGIQLMMMLGLGLAVVLFVGLVWVTAP
jgi:hypothetical protein